MLPAFMINLGLLLEILMRSFWKERNMGEGALVLVGLFFLKIALIIVLWLIWVLLGLVLLEQIKEIFLLLFKKGLTISLLILAGMPCTRILELLTSLDVCRIIARYFLRPIHPIGCFCLGLLNSKISSYWIYLFRDLLGRLGVGLDPFGNPLRFSLGKLRIGTRIILAIFLGKRKEIWLISMASKKQ